MMNTVYPHPLWITVLGFHLAATAHAETIVAPMGGQPIELSGRRVFCKERAELHGWSLEGDNATHLTPPASASPEDAPAGLRVAESGQCRNSDETIRAVAVTNWPHVDAASLTLHVDAGRLDLKGRNLRGLVMRWQSGAKKGGDVCRDPQVTANSETCALTVDRNLPVDPSATEISFFPAGTPSDDKVTFYDAQGRPIEAQQFKFTASRVVISALMPADAAVNADAEVGHLALIHPDSVGSVECVDASCEIDGNEVLVRGERGTDETLEVRLRLRPHIFAQGTTQLETVATVSVPVQRCPVAIVSAPPLRNISGQKLVVRVGGRCQKDSSLRFFISGNPSRLISGQVDGDALYAVLQNDRPFGSDDVVISIQRGGSVVGIARGRTRGVPAIHARLDLPDYGAIDFIPTNRDASVALPSVGDGGVLVPLPVDGVYTVSRDPAGVDHVRGIDGATGWVALRLAYRDKTLPPTLRDLNLAEIEEAVDRSIKSASLPIMLTTDANSLAELFCDHDGQSQRQKPGATNSVSFADRDTCSLILHRENLRLEDGEQTLRITATVNALDGMPRPESKLDQVVRLRPGPVARKIFIGGVVAPFDRVVIRVAVLADDTHYAVTSEEKMGAPPIQWSLIMGTTKMRLSATTSFPTGLFRVADTGHSGILGLNGGVLFRAVWLTDQGYQTPLGLETGVMWMGIAGDSTASSHGQVALVGGLGISVPIANVARVAQASISLHAWLEYEVSRAVLKQVGSPWGFVFGPSLSVGDVGVNF